jgi:predicted permease
MAPAGWLDAIRLRLRALFRGRRVDQDLNDELQFHLEHQIDEYVSQGVPHDRARTLALQRIGGLESQRELCREARGVGPVEHILRDIRGAARLLVRQPGFTVVAVLSLSLGIGANATIFQLLDSVKLRSLPVAAPEQLIRIDIANRAWVGDNYSGRYASLTSPLWESLAAHAEPFSGLLAWSHSTMDLAKRGESRFVENGLYVSAGFFTTLGVGAAAGRVFNASDDSATCTQGVVLSHAFWLHEYGGARSALGTTLTLNGKPFTIVGVSGRGFYGVEVGHSFDLAVPLCAESIINSGSTRRSSRSSWWLGVMGRLKPGWSLERASAYLGAASSSLFESTLPPDFSADDAGHYRGFRLAAEPGRSGFSQLRERYDDSLWLLLGVVGVVLLIACANLANLQLARMSAREREMSVRLAIGASRGRLVQQLLIESLLLALIGTAAGALFAPPVGRLIVGLISSDVNPMFIDLSPDWRVMGFLAALAIMTTALFGLMPALRAARVPPGAAMKAGGRGVIGGPATLALRRALVAVQVALSLVLVTAGLLFARSLFNLLSVDAGFAPAGLLEADVDMRQLDLSGQARAVLRDDILDRMRRATAVANVATVVSVPFVGNWWRAVYLDDGAGVKRAMGRFNWVSAGYFDTIGTPLLHGRDFDPRIDTPTSPRVAIVNQAFAGKHFGGGSPLGVEFRPEGARGGEPGQTSYRIIGVVGNTKHGGLRDPFEPIVYIAESQVAEPSPFVNIFIRPRAGTDAAAAAVRSVMAEANAGVAFHFHDVGRVTLESISQDRLMALLCGGFAILGGVLAAIGVYGVMAYSVARRRSEIGVRLALGAGRGSILGMVIWEAVVVVGTGVVIGAAIALSTSHVVASQLYAVEPSDPVTLAAAIALLAVVALVAAFLPANRAARTDPTIALRHE